MEPHNVRQLLKNVMKINVTSITTLGQIYFLWTMSEMVKYKGNAVLKRPKSGPVFHHL